MKTGKPNRKADIGFVIFYPYQFYPLKNIYYQLKEKSEFIVDWGPKKINAPREAFVKTIELLRVEGVFFRTLEQEDYQDIRLKNFFSKYRALIALTYHRCLKLDCNSRKVKIKMLYGGGGKALTLFSPIESLFDLYLAHSHSQKNLLKFYTSCEVVGDPRFDDWFNNNLDENFINEVKQKINPTKKTILYLPTHSNLSSLPILKEEIKRISKIYNVILKPHHLTIYEEPELVEDFKNTEVILFDDTVDVLPLLKIGDAILSDNSSVILEALLVNKPLIVADFWDKEFIGTEHRSLHFFRNQPRKPATYSGSIEQVVKKVAAIAIKKPTELESAMKKTLNFRTETAEFRNRIIKDAYSFTDGKCALRAKEAIENFLALEKLPEKPILYHIFDTYCTWDESQKLINIDKIRKLPLLKKIKFIFEYLLNI